MLPRALATVATALLAVGCEHPHEPVQPTTIITDGKSVTLTGDAPQWKYLELGVALEGPPLNPLPAPGHVDLDEKRTANVGAPLAGRVEAVEVRVGDWVRQGARLFSVRSGAYADLDRELETARAEMNAKQRVLQRVKDLYMLKAAPEKDVLAAEAELKSVELAFKAAQAKKQSLAVDSAGANLFWVHAPRDGTVVDLDVFANQEVTPDRDKPLLRISDLDEVLVLADVPETDVVDVRVGGEVQIRTQVGAVDRTGVVDHISEVVDARRRTVEVRVRMENKDRGLRANAFVEVMPIPDPTLKRLKVPDTAVVNAGKRQVIFIQRGGPGRLEPREVATGRRRGGEVEITAGLEPEMRYIRRGALLLLNKLEEAN